MSNLTKILTVFLDDERGQDIVEYALIAALVALGCNRWDRPCGQCGEFSIHHRWDQDNQLRLMHPISLCFRAMSQLRSAVNAED